MSEVIEALVDREYAFGFHSDLETDLAPRDSTRTSSG